MRLDQYLVIKKIIESRNKAQYEINNGNVKVNNKVITKCSFECTLNDVISLDKSNELKYVSKGGLKLEKAISFYNIDVKGLACLDIGASTGGFTDVLIKNGASKVYAIDTGKNQLHESLKNNPKIISMEETNFLEMDLSSIDKIDLIVIDVSFTKVEPILDRIFKEFKDLIVVFLIKPQFELGKMYIKNGVVKDTKLHNLVLKQISTYLNNHNIFDFTIIDSPILGGSGNKEFLTKIKI